MRSVAIKVALPLAVIVALASGCGSDEQAGTTSGGSTAPASESSEDTAASSSTGVLAPGGDDAPTATTPVGPAESIDVAATEPSTSAPVSSDDTSNDTSNDTSDETSDDSGVPQGSDDTVFEQGDIDLALQSWIDMAVNDLAGRLGVESGAIEVHSAVLVVWPDQSLGCPAKGMQYAQVTVDGSMIELTTGGRAYRYHAGGSTTPFLCEAPLTVPPSRLG